MPASVLAGVSPTEATNAVAVVFEQSTRILGEIKKLGINSVSRNTVQNILKANGLDPGPKRGTGTWGRP
jgi:hypothetical protein